MSEYQNNSIFWVETEKIGANPFQPRREFNPDALGDLADSIRQYGVLQPLVVTRKEEQNENGGISVFYELIAGERRLRAARLAGLDQVPVIIRKETNDKIKLELAIIENLQREDLNAIDRALAFEQLYKEFKLTHAEIGKKMGKSRVYVSNSLRLLSLPDTIKQGLMDGRITEGHTRPLLMLSDKPQEQDTLYREIMLKKMSVRESEKVARSIAQDRVRKKKFVRDPRLMDYEKKLSENLGTRVQIEQKEKGGKITIDYFSVKDLEGILASINKVEHESGETMMDSYINEQDKITSQKILSQSGPINFMSGEIKINQFKKEPFVSEKKSLPDDQNISAEIISEISPLPEIKKLEEYVHHSDEEIVEHKESLAEHKHIFDEEIVEYKEPSSKQNINIQNSTLETTNINYQSEPWKNSEKESFSEINAIENPQFSEQEKLISEKMSVPEHNPYIENIQDNVDTYHQLSQNKSFEQNSVQNTPTHNNIQNQNQYPGQDVYQNQQQNIHQRYQNEVENYQYQQPKKKGFFGRIFS